MPAPTPRSDEIEAAAAAANIHDFIVALPDGYATEVGERGMRLSGGERQRISLARAFLKDAPILILDEPTSSVDVKTEAVIMEAMERLMSGRTSFMIAHRLSTLEVCDLRLEMDGGRVVTRRGPRRPSAAPASPRQDAQDHPRSSAWQSLGGAQPRRVEVLKESKRSRKPGVYRLEGAGPGGSPVIAKICKRKTAEIESAVYEELLPNLPMPSLRYYGKVRDGDRQHCWLFMDDAGDERHWPLEPEHRRLAARWLATIQLHAGEFVQTSALPDRGPRHYLVHLLNAREEIERHLRRPSAAADGPLVLGDLLAMLDLLESRWPEVAAFCDTLPRTLVHGDLVPKNMRILRDGRNIGLAVFDWETAGLGVQAPDLAQLLEPQRSWYARRKPLKRIDRFSANPCLDTYRSVLAGSAMELDTETSRNRPRSETCSVAWPASTGPARRPPPTWYPVDDFRVYSEWLGNAMQIAGWSAPGRRVLEPTMTSAQLDVTLGVRAADLPAGSTWRAVGPARRSGAAEGQRPSPGRRHRRLANAR